MIQSAAQLIACFTLLMAAGCGRPAQIGSDRATFRAVDALYTAVSMRNPKLVEQCEANINGLKAQNKIPAAAAAALASFIAEAKEGDWEPAQTGLATFMEGQRR